MSSFGSGRPPSSASNRPGSSASHRPGSSASAHRPGSSASRRPGSRPGSSASRRPGTTTDDDDDSSSDDENGRRKNKWKRANTPLDAEQLGLERPADFLRRLNADDYSSDEDTDEEERQRRARDERRALRKRNQKLPPGHSLHRRNSRDIIEVEESSSESDASSSEGDFDMGLAEHYDFDELEMPVQRSLYRDRLDAQVELMRKKRAELRDRRRDPVVMWHEKQFLHQLNAKLLAEHEAKERAVEEKERDDRRAANIAKHEAKQEELTEERRLWLEGDTLVREKARECLEQRIAIKIPVVKNKTERRRAAEAERQRVERERREAAERAELKAKVDAAEAATVAQYDEDVRETQWFKRLMRQSGLRPGVNPPEPQEDEVQRESLTRVSIRVSDQKRNFQPVLNLDLHRFRSVTCIDGVQLGTVGAKLLADHLAAGDCPRVTRINLGWCGIRTRGAATLFQCFQFNVGTYLREMDLRFNRLEAPMLRALLATFERGALKQLKLLDLRGNIMQDRGALTLAHTILAGQFKAIETLILQKCDIRDLGASALYKALCTDLCPAVQHVDLRHNRISAACKRTFSPCPPCIQV